MNLDEYYPQLVQNFPEFDGRFTARKLVAQNCDVLFATYPAGTIIDSHSHATENVERISAGDRYHVPTCKEHTAKFLEDKRHEFWFSA